MSMTSDRLRSRRAADFKFSARPALLDSTEWRVGRPPTLLLRDDYVDDLRPCEESAARRLSQRTDSEPAAYPACTRKRIDLRPIVYVPARRTTVGEPLQRRCGPPPATDEVRSGHQGHQLLERPHRPQELLTRCIASSHCVRCISFPLMAITICCQCRLR